MNTTTHTTLSNLRKQAHDRHTIFLQWLIDRRIRRMSPEHQQISNALQAIESIADWRETTEWAVKYGKADIAEFAMSRLQEWCDRLSSAVESFGGIDGILRLSMK